jgi:hypothetical protein
MKKPSFFQGVVVAALLSMLCSVSVAGLAPVLGLPATLRVLIPVLGLVYILYLFRHNEERTGRVTALAAWAVLAAASWWFAPPLSLYLLIHATAIWLVRSLYYYAGILPSLLDLALGGFAVAACAWAASHSGSVFLACWCFFLVQASFVAIPPVIRGRQRLQTDAVSHNDAFERARRQADSALRQLFTHERL